MKKFLVRTKYFFSENIILFAAFFIPSALLLTAYAFAGIYPFGEKSVLAVDFSTQYVYFFEYLHNVFSGKESLFYNWSGSLSGSFYGTYAYYIASPFNLLVLLFPRENLTEGIFTMLLVKAGAAGLTMSFFLKKHRKYSDFTSLLFSPLYALSGYAAANTINPMWLDAVILLPLIICGIENICKKRGFILYVITLFLAIISNYYTGYMLCVFSGIYFIGFIVSKRFAHKRRKVGIFALSSAAAVFMSGFVILPAFLPLLEGKLDNGLDRVEFRECFNIMDGILKFYPTVYDTQRYGGLPFLYCGLFTLIFAVSYFFCRKFPVRERIVNGVICGALMFSMYFKPLDNLWHGGRAPMWFEHRYSFLLIFMLIILGAGAFESIKNVRARYIGSAFLILLGVFLIANGFKQRDFKNAEYIALFSILFLTVAAICALLIKKSAKLPIKMIVLGLVCTELYVNTTSYISDIDNDFVYQDRGEYVSQMKEMREISDSIKADDSGFYRVEKTFSRAFNDNIGAGIYGVSFSTSVYNANVLEMMRKLGFGQYDWHTTYKGSTMFLDDILGIKYVMSKDEGLVPYTEKNGIVYKNPDAMPIAFLSDKHIINSAFTSADPISFQQDLASALLGEQENIFTKIRSYSTSFKNVSAYGYNYQKNNTSKDGMIIYTFTAPKSGAFYAYFPTEREYGCALYVNGKYLRGYFNGFEHSTAYLGSFSANEQIEVGIKLYGNNATFDNPIFCVIDEKELETFTEKFPHYEVKKAGNQTLEITLEANDDSALFTTIPYERGWSAYIDGKKCNISTAVNNTLLCIEVPKGKHTITLSFFPDGLAAGIAMTICGAVLFAGMIAVRSRFLQKKKKSFKS